MPNAGSISVRLVADTQDFQKGIEDSAKSVQKFSSQFARVGSDGEKALNSINFAMGNVANAADGMARGLGKSTSVVAELSGKAFQATGRIIDMTSAATGLLSVFSKLAPLLALPEFLIGAAGLGAAAAVASSITAGDKAKESLRGGADRAVKPKFRAHVETAAEEAERLGAGAQLTIIETREMQQARERAATAAKKTATVFEREFDSRSLEAAAARRADEALTKKAQEILKAREATAALAQRTTELEFYRLTHSKKFVDAYAKMEDEELKRQTERLMYPEPTSAGPAPMPGGPQFTGPGSASRSAVDASASKFFLNFHNIAVDVASFADAFHGIAEGAILKIADAIELIPAALRRAGGIVDKLSKTGVLQSASNTITGAAAKAAPITTAAVQGFVQGGWIGALVAALAQLLIQTQAFTKILEVVESSIGGLVPILSKALLPFAHLVEVLLLPVHKLFPLLDGLAAAFSFVVLKISDVIGIFITGGEAAFDAVITGLQTWFSDLGLASVTRRLEELKSGADLQDALKKLIEFNPHNRIMMNQAQESATDAATGIGEIVGPAEDLTNGFTNLNSTVHDLNYSMVNVPAGFKVNQARFDSIIRGFGDTILQTGMTIDNTTTTIADAANGIAHIVETLAPPDWLTSNTTQNPMGQALLDSGLSTTEAPNAIGLLSMNSNQPSVADLANVFAGIYTNQATITAGNSTSLASTSGALTASEGTSPGVAASPITVQGDLNFNGIEDLDNITDVILAKLKLANFQTSGNPAIPGYKSRFLR